MILMSIRTGQRMALCALVSLLTLSGQGCPEGTVLPNFLAPTPIWSSIVSDSYWDVGQTGTAAAVVVGALGDVSYEWTITPPGEIVSGADKELVSFTASAPGSSTLVLTAHDTGTGTTATAALQIDFSATTQSAPDEPLTVDAGPGQSVAVGQTVLLAGSVTGGSSCCSISTYWRQVSGPVQRITPEWSNNYGTFLTVVGTSEGDAVYMLIAENSYDNSVVTDTTTVHVTASAPE